LRKIIGSPAVGDGKMWHGYHLKALIPGFLAVPYMYGRIYFSREELASGVDFGSFGVSEFGRLQEPQKKSARSEIR
jgi:hypothetical protein